MIRWGIIVGAFVIDIVMKLFVRQLPATAGRFAFWSSVGPIGIVPSVNDVLAFSLPIPNVVIWPVGWIVVLFLVYTLVRSGSKFQILNSKFQIRHRRLAITAIVLGAISNLFDRTFLGGVTDYLSLTNLFPAFNIADLLILGGVAGWAWFERRAPRGAPL